jgi:hypothetical protein
MLRGRTWSLRSREIVLGRELGIFSYSLLSIICLPLSFSTKQEGGVLEITERNFFLGKEEEKGENKGILGMRKKSQKEKDKLT